MALIATIGSVQFLMKAGVEESSEPLCFCKYTTVDGMIVFSLVYSHKRKEDFIANERVRTTAATAGAGAVVFYRRAGRND